MLCYRLAKKTYKKIEKKEKMGKKYKRKKKKSKKNQKWWSKPPLEKRVANWKKLH